MTNIDFRFYCITDRHLCAPNSLTEVVQEIALNGVKAVQLREKDLPARHCFEIAKELFSCCAAAGTKLLINDRADIACAANADGVHLTARSLPVAVVRQKILRDGLISVSTHAFDEAVSAQQAGADFVLFGPVFETPSKMAYGPPRGLEELRRVAGKLDIPVFAIGGIDAEKAAVCRQAGAHGVAVISALMQAKSIPATVSHFRMALGEL